MKVSLIITQEERAIFLKLTTDKDRERFVPEFWERAIPSPGVPQRVQAGES
jgi:GWxTD domain-containing protein